MIARLCSCHHPVLATGSLDAFWAWLPLFFFVFFFFWRESARAPQLMATCSSDARAVALGCRLLMNKCALFTLCVSVLELNEGHINLLASKTDSVFLCAQLVTDTPLPILVIMSPFIRFLSVYVTRKLEDLVAVNRPQQLAKQGNM